MWFCGGSEVIGCYWLSFEAYSVSWGRKCLRYNALLNNKTNTLFWKQFTLTSISILTAPDL